MVFADLRWIYLYAHARHSRCLSGHQQVAFTACETMPPIKVLIHQLIPYPLFLYPAPLVELMHLGLCLEPHLPQHLRRALHA